MATNLFFIDFNVFYLLCKSNKILLYFENGFWKVKPKY